jgi:predicted dehydrogenase
MNELRFAVLGAGFWAPYQLAAWQEVPGARCVAIYNRTRSKGEALARRFGIPAVYDDARELLVRERPDFVDIITDVGAHAEFVHLAAEHRVNAICQKPLAESLQAARAMEAACRDAGVSLLVHENWRWQTPIRRLKQVLDSGQIGRLFRARIQYSSSFPVFIKQPFLKELEQFLLMDIGTHILDVARFLFGEPWALFCRTARVHADIRGEDVATVMMAVDKQTSVVCEMSYASRLEHERFPETFILVEGDEGSAELAPDYWLRVTTAAGTHAQRHPPPRYAWAEPAYDLAQASIVPCNANLLSALRGEGPAETTAEDNLRTLELVFAAYESARTGRAVELDRSQR